MASKLNVDKIARGSGSPEFTIPTADGSADQFLKTNGSGVLSFDTVTTTALTGSTNTWIPTITGANALTGTANFTYDGNTLDIKNGGTASSINLYCETGNAHYIKLKSGPHASATSYTLTLPNAPPSVSGQVLSATTGGIASWAAADPYGSNSCQMYKSGNQTMPNNTITLFTADSAQWDTHGSMANTGNNRIDIKTAGKYWVYGTLWWDGSGASESRYIYIHHYDASASTDTVLQQWTWQQTSASAPTQTHTGIGANLDVDDYIYVKGFQNANNSVCLGAIGKSSFGVMRIE